MSRMEKLLVFSLSGLHCPLRLADIEKILPAVEVSPVPKAPGIEYLEGLMKLKDRILYIYNLDGFLSSEERVGIEHLLSGEREMPVGREQYDCAQSYLSGRRYDRRL